MENNNFIIFKETSVFQLVNKSNISAKLNAFLVLPIITLLFFFSITIFDKYKQLEKTENVLHFSLVVQQLSNLISNLQKERGLSAGALFAKSTNHQIQLTEQRKVTMLTFDKVSHVFVNPPRYLPQKAVSNFKKIGQEFEKLRFIRTEIDNNIDNNFFTFYSVLISDLLQKVNVLHAMATNQETHYMVSSLIYALGHEEYAAIERGLVYGALSELKRNKQINNIVSLGVTNHVARQQAELTRFYNVASPKHYDLMIEVMEDKKIKAFHLYESNIGELTYIRSSSELVNPEVWWQLATQRLSLLHKVSSTITNDILTLEKTANKKLQIPLVLYSLFVFMVLVIAVLLSQRLKRRLVDQIEYIAHFMKNSRINKQSNQFLEITGDDEIAVMANEFNQLMVERSENEEQLKLAAQVYVEAHEGIFITKTDGTIVDVNPAFCQITGYEREDVLGKNPKILNSDKQSKQFYKEMWECVIAHGYWKGEVWNRKKNGELYAELLTISSLKDDCGNTLHYMGLFADITQIKKQHHSLEQMAHYDPLTLLPNRTLFIDRFNQAVIYADRTKTSLAICFIDLDNFKPINDNYGHNVGDSILIEIASRIKANLRSGDTISRQGGDEFALLLSNIHNFSDCEDIIKRIHSSLAKPFIINGVSHAITASTGITLYPNDYGDLDTLLRHADQAMYQIKQSEGDGYCLFNMDEDQQTIKKQQKLNILANAINNDEFTLYYQPKVNMKTGEVYGAEALVRWLSPEEGLIYPNSFLPILENTNVDIELGRWVINDAIKQLTQWQRNGIMIEVSINISSYHLQSLTFVDDLKEILDKYTPLDTSYIQLEVLENSALGDLNAISNTLNSCRDKFGLQIALDDFGTGYSSLTHIKSLPANVIKIDQSFVIDLLNDANNYSIINGVLGLAKSFSRDVIAEGVETTAHGLMLLMMGCDKAQGYGIARPMPVNEFNHWLTLYQPNPNWLAWASEAHSLKENSLKIFDIALQHEFTALLKRVESPSIQSDEHIKRDHNTVCCGWLKRKKQSALFSKSWLEELEYAYHSMYHCTRMPHQQQTNSKTNVSISSEDIIKNSYDNVMKVLSGVH